MDSFSIRDLRERTGELVRDAEAGRLSVVTKRGRPVFVAVPFDEALLEQGVNVALAAKLYADGVVTLSRAARVAGVSTEAFIEKLGLLGVPVVDYPPDELDEELARLA
ncbi:MAG: type II toxin-antitoxin system prevent-host-death family antitoxin [Nitrospirota bacterium]|jgi:prevent-host-death family protein